MKKIALLIVIPLFLMACATAERGQKFDTSQSAQIEIGKTTEAEVITLLGSPYRTQVKATGEKAFLYAHVEARVIPGSVTSKSQHFAVLFDKNGIVKAIDKVGI